MVARISQAARNVRLRAATIAKALSRRLAEHGRPLSICEFNALSKHIPEVDLLAARIHEGVPWYLPGRYIGITRGSNIYFRPGVFEPDTTEGLALLGHELVHVGQYRCGATWLSFLWSYRTGYSNSHYEKAAC